MKLKTLLVALLLSLVPALGSAAEQANAPTVTGETGLFTLLSGDTLPRGNWSFGLYYNNWDRVLDLDGIDVEEESVDWNRLSASLGYGITDRWEVSLAVPYEDYNFDLRGADLDASGLGNARLGTKFRLLGGAGDPSTLALNLFVELPTGDDDIASDDPGFGAGLGWRVNKWVIDVGYRTPGDDFADELHGGLGYVGQVSENLDWITEVAGTFYSGDDRIGFEDAYDLTTGGRLWLGDGNWAFNFALRTDLAQLGDIDEHCPIGGLLGLTYFPRLFVREEPAPPPAPAPPPPPAPAPPPPPAPAPPPPPPPPAPAPRPEERVTVNFTPGSARLSNIAKAKLDEVALKMKQDPDLRAQVIGYTDASGSADANQRMSEQRAQAVKNYLVTRHGIDPSRITTEGRGSADSTGNAEDDRRAVVILTVQ
ncbi:MAG TPA: OmpA family protein [Thermoanaerobaculia bacterium]|nr:OmpA family protein [Thermoanaerobaculia bacterium]